MGPSGRALRSPAWIAALLFGSGFCSLVYQSAWMRSLRLVFGCATPATAAVLAVFMGGLGLGALWLGQRAERSANPLRLYAFLELGIALGAALSPFLVAGVRAVYLGIGGVSTLGELGATVVRLVLSALVLAGPVTLMGGTLPAAGRAITTSSDVGRKGLALVYGVNAVGAVLGAVLPVFVLFERWGERRTLLAACTLNVLIAATAYWLSGRPAPRVEPAVGSEPPPREEPAAPARLLLAGAFVTGFCFLLAELVWYRLAGPILGGSTYTFGLVLAFALAGIGTGGVLYAWFGPTRPTAGSFAVTCALEALALLVPYALGDDLALLAHHLRELSLTFPGRALGWALIAAILVFPAALVSGYQFPLLVALKGRRDDGVGVDVGQLYAANTLGAIVGSLAGGFGLLPLLTAPGAWLGTGVALLAVGGLFAVFTARREPRRAAGFGVVALLALLCTQAVGPTAVWRHSGIGIGVLPLTAPSWNKREDILLQVRNWTRREREGRECSIGISGWNGFTVMSGGKSDGNVLGDAQTQVLLGLLPAMIHPDPKRAFVVGLGTGETAGWLAEVPSIEHVDVVELEPAVVEFARDCAIANHGVIGHPKVSVALGDGREALMTTRQAYDIIVSEPSNPYRAGVASFYTSEFYRQVRARLAPGGLFAQWMQTYRTDGTTVMIALATLRAEFGSVSTWQLQSGDVLFLASTAPQAIDIARVRERLPREPYRTGFGRIAGCSTVECFLAHHYANDALAREALDRSQGELNTDDATGLEYRFARTIGTEAHVAVHDLIAAASEAHADRPDVVGGPVDWARIDLLRARTFQASGAEVPPLPVRADAAPRLMLWQALAHSDHASALRLLSRTPPAADDPFEQLLVADLLAQQRELPRPVLFSELEKLAALGFESDARWIRLEAVATDGVDAQVLRFAKPAFEAARSDPWIRSGLVGRVLERLPSLVQDPAVARELAAALMEGPFAVGMEEERRRVAALRLAMAGGAKDVALRVLELNEPFPAWQEPMLELRERVYRESGSPRAAAARADLERFRAHDVARLRDLLAPRENR